MLDFVISLVSLASLLVILVELSEGEGGPLRWPAGVWATVLLALCVVAAVKVVRNLETWSHNQVLTGLVAAANFLAAAALLVIWLCVRRKPT
jgi:hypothetical protein